MVRKEVAVSLNQITADRNEVITILLYSQKVYLSYLYLIAVQYDRSHVEAIL